MPGQAPKTTLNYIRLRKGGLLGTRVILATQILLNARLVNFLAA